MSNVHKLIVAVSAGIISVLAGAILFVIVPFWLLTEDSAMWIILPAAFGLSFGAGFVAAAVTTISGSVEDSLPANRRTICPK